LAEAEALIKDKETDKVSGAMEDYDAEIAQANKETKLVKDETKEAKLLSIIADNYTRHQEVLNKVLEQVPDKAKDSIRKVIEKSQEKYQEKIGEIEELKKDNQKLKEEIEKIKGGKNEDKSKDDKTDKKNNGDKKDEEENNFEETGTILDWDAATETYTGKWRLLYDKPGVNAITVSLIFNDKSLCKTEGKDKPCSEVTFKNSDGAKVKGVKVDGGILVRMMELPVRGSNSKNEKQIGYIKKVYDKDGKKYMDIDYIQWLNGVAAEKAIEEDGHCRNENDCTPDNGYYIRNQNPQIRTLEIYKNADIFDEFGFSAKMDIVKPSTVNPYNIELSDDNVVIRITKQYIP